MAKPLVTAIVTHHLTENWMYFNHCFNSLVSQDYESLDIICVSDASEPPDVHSDVTLIWDKSLDNASKKVHFAITKADPATEYYLLVGDDVILPDCTVRKLVEASTLLSNLVILNPMSNNDVGSRYVLMQRFLNNAVGETLPLLPEYTLKDVEPFLSSIAAMVPTTELVIPTDYVSFFCTLIPKTIWERVNGLDEELDYRHNDHDFCLRAKKLGFSSAMYFGAFALHYGSKTLKKIPDIEAQQNICTEKFIKKHGLR